jgi:hypothetical protein
VEEVDCFIVPYAGEVGAMPLWGCGKGVRGGWRMREWESERVEVGEGECVRGVWKRKREGKREG